MAKFNPVVGIDLGTTFSAIAYVDEHGKATVIRDEDGNPTMHSVIYWPNEKEACVIGSEAKNMCIVEPENTVQFIKRHMGQENYKQPIGDQDLSPQFLSSLILKKLIQYAQQHFKEQGIDAEIKDVVITVPAYFGMNQKSATEEAGELAGLNILGIQTESTAAATPYAVNKDTEKEVVFVFDLGGGTFDVSIMNITGDQIKEIAADGSPELGGKDWDDVLVKYCAEQFLFAHPSAEDPRNDSSTQAPLYENVLRAKISLSQKPKTKVLVTSGGVSETVEITQDLFEEQCQDLLRQCKLYCNEVLEKANISWGDIDNVLLVGGSTKMPMIKKLVESLSGKNSEYLVNPDECVALGAAYYANALFVKGATEKGAEALKEVVVSTMSGINIAETTPKSLGVILKGGVVYEMVPEQSDIPCNILIESFTYAEDGQTELTLMISEGSGKLEAEVVIVGELFFDDLPPKKIGDPISLRYIYNNNKILEVIAIDLDTGREMKGEVSLKGSMNKDEKESGMRAISKANVE